MTNMILDRGPVLDREPVRMRIEACFKSNGESINLLLAGPWGSGKTTLLRGAELALKENKYHVMWFSPWESLADTDVRNAFLIALVQEWRRVNPLSRDPWAQDLPEAKRKLWGWGKDLVLDAVKEAVPFGKNLAALLDAVVGAVGEANKSSKEDSRSEVEKQRERLKKMIGQITEGNQKKLLLIVDDLDRCRPEDAVKLLDMLYHFFMPREGGAQSKDWPLSSIWAVNMPVLEEFLYREYRDLPSFDSVAYLEKIFHFRINVPPMSDPETEGAVLWEKILASSQFDRKPSGLAKELAKCLNYAVLGNLRLYGKLRAQCLAYWVDEAAPDKKMPSYLNDARLLTLVVAFPGFRENIALYPGMWPEFVNRLNSGAHYQPQMADNPAFRYLRDQTLMTLLMDLGVLSHDGTRYKSNQEQQQTLRKSLLEMLRNGF